MAVTYPQASAAASPNAACMTASPAGPHRSTTTPTAIVSAYLEAGVLADVGACHQNWCRLSGNGFSGWIGEEQLWGVYPGEEIP